jgi:hypothetical protein
LSIFLLERKGKPLSTLFLVEWLPWSHPRLLPSGRGESKRNIGARGHPWYPGRSVLLHLLG